MGRIISCTNEDGEVLRLGGEFSPWLLLDAEGLYGSEANVCTSENTMTDGSTYQGTTLKMRNIILSMTDSSDHRHSRQILYDVFKPKSPGTLSYTEDGETRTIRYYVEKIEIGSMGRMRTATVSLLCPDPYFQAAAETRVIVAGWAPLWEFAHEFPMEGGEFGQKSDEKLKTIMNDSAADSTGMTITISTTGQVRNPSITRVETQEKIQIGTAARPMTMEAGDELVITTGTNDKHVYLTHGGVTRECNEYMDEASVFIQLMRGANTIGYDAESGAEYMSVACVFRYRYPGV